MTKRAGGSRPCERATFLRATVIDAPLLATDGATGEARSSSRLVMHGSRKRVRVRDDGANWPTRTDQWCWYCCHPFDTQPLPLPTRYDDKLDLFHVMGNFCSWSCMKAYNSSSASYLKAVHANIITLFHKKCTGKLQGIRSAPPRQALKVFGGVMSIEEFRAASSRPVEYQVLPAHMIVYQHAIHEHDTQALARDKARTLKNSAPDLKEVVSFKDVSTKNETLRLKRPKPLQKNRNLLERTMGIQAMLGTVSNTL